MYCYSQFSFDFKLKILKYQDEQKWINPLKKKGVVKRKIESTPNLTTVYAQHF